MDRTRFALVAALVGASFAGVTDRHLLAQKAPEFKTVLAGKKLTPPLRGEANIDFVRTQPRRDGTTLLTRIQVRNQSDAPIQRLAISETWYDKSGNVMQGGQGVAEGLLQPGEIKTIEIRTDVNANMSQSKYMFVHANGTVKTHEVRSFGAAPKEAATKPPARSAPKK